jgi:sigma-E factor negative regulatory protein RseB
MLALWAAGQFPFAAAQTFSVGPSATPQSAASSPFVTGPRAVESKYPERSISEWLVRIHEASRLRSYVGTFVVSSGSGALSSARIWHACDGQQQMERVESLTGLPRSTFRRNDEVLTFLPESRIVRTERRESLGLFPDLLKTSETSIPSSTARAASAATGLPASRPTSCTWRRRTTCASATGCGARRRPGW